MSGKAALIGPHSRPQRLAKIDRRTRESRLMQETRAALVAHLGGDASVSAVQSRLIDRAVMLTLHTAMFDAKALEAGGMSERDSRQYLAYSNSLARCLAQLGLKGAASQPQSIAEQLASLAVDRDAAA